MPFKSVAQQKYLYANKPSLAKKWQREYGNPPKKKRVRRKKTSAR